MAVLLCPLCSQPRFNSLESLRFSLIKVATQNISCPICNEIVAGLDKLTIHLFGHTINQCSETLMELNVTKSDSLSNVSPSLENQKAKEREKANDSNDLKLGDERDGKNGDACTVNMEDLSFLTSWENCFRTDDLDDLGEKSQSPKTVNSNAEEPLKSPREDSNQLSEYMSDLLTKKLPILNFAFTMDASEKSEPDKQGEGSENSQFKCPKCDFAFQNSIIFSMHQELVHSTKKIDDKKTKPKNVNENLAFDSSFRPLNFSDENLFKDLVLPSYDCHLCQKSYKMKGSLLVHYRVAHLGLSNSDSSVSLANQDGTGEKNFCCSICNKSFKKEQHLTQHIKTHEGKQWRCETCNKYFTTKYFLKKHQRLHTGEMPYSCQTCNKTFTFQQSYHKHLLYHSDEKPHQCTQCGRAFKELSTLHNHQRIHSGEKPFACETCGKCFRQRVSYIVHQRIHTGVLPYQCTACKKKFRYKVSQRSHKCTSQPPGIVIRQAGEFVQQILEQRSDALSCSLAKSSN